jgi:hypothetical protein
MIKTKKLKWAMNAGKHIKNWIVFKRWHGCCLLFFFAGCFSGNGGYKRLSLTKEDSAVTLAVEKKAFAEISNAEKIIRSGDLVTRTGNDFTSEMLRKLNQHDNTYSHCGIASIENDSVFIYHALGGEFNPDQKIRKDLFAGFCEPYNNRGFGIFRFQLPPAALNKTVLAAKESYLAGIMFDMKFDLATNDRVYCAEFVYKSFLAGSNHTIPFNISRLKDFMYVGVDDLFLSEGCKEVKRIVYR